MCEKPVSTFSQRALIATRSGRVAGFTQELEEHCRNDKRFKENRARVKTWNEIVRYEIFSEMEARGMNPEIILIVALARNRVIGADNGLPWRLSSDLKRFRALTLGKPLIMGRRTYDSIGRPLDGREIITVSRDPDFAPAAVHVARDPESALTLAAERAHALRATEIVVAGGAQIYELFLRLANRIYLTEVALDAPGDTVFPDLDPSAWREVAREIPARGIRDDADFAWITLERAHEAECAQRDHAARSTSPSASPPSLSPLGPRRGPFRR